MDRVVVHAHRAWRVIGAAQRHGTVRHETAPFSLHRRFSSAPLHVQALKLSPPAPEAECTGMDTPCWAGHHSDSDGGAAGNIVSYVCDCACVPFLRVRVAAEHQLARRKCADKPQLVVL